MPSQKKKRFIIISIVVLLLFAGFVVYLRTPLFYRHLAHILAYKYGFVIHADNIDYAPFLKANISNLQIKHREKSDFLFSSSQVNLESKPSMAIRGEVERIILKEPRIQIRIGDKKSTQTDLSFIKNIPPVHTLTIQKGQFKLTFLDKPFELIFRDINLDVQDFSPDKGGRVTFNGLVDIASSRQTNGIFGHGYCKGSMSLKSILPDLIGTGTLDVQLNNGVFNSTSLENMGLHILVSFEKERINVTQIDVSSDLLIFDNSKSRSFIKKPYLKTNMKYELKTKNLSFESFEFDIPTLGNLKGNFSGKMKEQFPWRATVDAANINFSALFSYLKPYIGKSGDNAWSIQGKGSLKSEIEGTLKGNESALSGKAILSFKNGGFNSMDGKSAAQDIEGTMVLKFSIPRDSKKTSAYIHSELSSGEYLFGKYYKNLKNESKKVSFETNIETFA